MPTRKTLNPKLIHLREVPKEGRTYTYSSESGEITDSIRDLVGKNHYEASLFIQPMGNVFQLSGSISTSLDLQCSLCAIDFPFKVRADLQEVLIPIDKRPQQGPGARRGDTQAKVNHTTEMDLESPQSYEVESGHFDVGEYLHEVIALEEPFQPRARTDCDETCENFVQFKAELAEKGLLDPVEVHNSESAHPFASLKALKKPPQH